MLSIFYLLFLEIINATNVITAVHADHHETQVLKLVSEPFYYFKNLGRFYIFNIYCSKPGSIALTNLTISSLSCCRYTQWNCINIAQDFEQNRFSFHYRKCSFRSDISKTKNPCSIADYGYVVPL